MADGAKDRETALVGMADRKSTHFFGRVGMEAAGQAAGDEPRCDSGHCPNV